MIKPVDLKDIEAVANRIKRILEYTTNETLIAELIDRDISVLLQLIDTLKKQNEFYN